MNQVEDNKLKKWLKISVLGLALFALTGCSNAEKKDEVVTGVVPSKQAEESSNSGSENSENIVDPVKEPEGDSGEKRNHNA